MIVRALVFSTAARCCSGYYVEGVRPDGASRCVQIAKGDDAGCKHREPCDLSHVPDPPAYGIAIHCTGGSVPIVVDAQTIGCQRASR